MVSFGLRSTSLLLLLVSTVSAASAGESYEAFRGRVLELRVRQLLTSRLDGLRRCVKKESSAPALALRKDISLELLRKPSGDPQQVVSAIHLFAKSEELAANQICTREIRASDQRLRGKERKPFIAPVAAFIAGTAPVAMASLNPKIPAVAAQFIAELDPWCAVGAVPSWGNHVLETNPCFAGDAMILKELTGGAEALPLETDNRMKRFAVNLYETVGKLPVGGSVDLWNEYRAAEAFTDGKSEREHRRMFLATLALLATANTAREGYVDGFGDYSWRSALSTTASAPQAFDAYVAQKQLKDLFSATADIARKKRARYFIGKSDTLLANRHNVMAAFLGCHYGAQGQKALARLIPRAIGIAYEAKDLKSHLSAGVSIHDSLENFRVDTARYRTSSQWGYEFCAR